MPYLNKETVSIYYEVHGEGAPLVFLHGLGGSMSAIKDTYQLVDGVQLILIDGAGHGQSTMDESDYGFEQLAHDVIDVIKHLDLESVVLAGISMGAAISLKVSLIAPELVSKLVLIRSAWVNEPMDPQFVQMYELTSEYLGKRDMDGLKQTQEYKDYAQNSSYLANSLLNYFTDEASLKYPQKLRILPKTHPFDSWDELKKIEIPTLVIGTQHDPLHPFEISEQLAKHIPHSTFIEIPSKTLDAQSHLRELNLEMNRFID